MGGGHPLWCEMEQSFPFFLHPAIPEGEGRDWQEQRGHFLGDISSFQRSAVAVTPRNRTTCLVFLQPREWVALGQHFPFFFFFLEFPNFWRLEGAFMHG